ncbi:MAG: hypothetical protein QNJ47_15085 [Nostocaceae cyanobacterium]|nr:hypothetical protein [Nostocaceae cyanobacterium]
MFPPQNRGRHLALVYVILQTILFFSVNHQTIVFAHKVKISADVGATLHIEPNDTPRAGEPTQVWFALTRKGGKVIPLAECDCQLDIYAEPHAPGEPALLEPALEPVTAERYQGIPGTKINFPRPGNYQLQLKGKPVTGKSFQPFELKFDVTVAVGNRNISQSKQNVNENTGNGEAKGVSLWLIAFFAVVGIGLLGFVVQKLKRSL